MRGCIHHQRPCFSVALAFAVFFVTTGAPQAATSPEARATARRLGRDMGFEDPSGKALASFHAALKRARTGKGKARIVFYGASHTASDLFTGVVRRELQKRFGDAGHGFVLPARPWNAYRHDDVVIQGTNTWRADRVGKSDSVQDGWYGLAGVSVASNRPDDVGILSTGTGPIGRKVDTFELWYLRQPGGGTLEVRLDGRRVRRLSTAAPEKVAAYALFKTRDGPHSLEVRPVGDGEVRVFGVLMERRRSGVVLDTVGIPGSRAVHHLQWNDLLYREHLSRRRPDLVALAYGTNEAGDDDVPIEDYERQLRQVITRIREVTPHASCLLIGPSDRPIAMPDGTWAPRPRTARIVEVQRRLAMESGCAFFDLVDFMGGEMAMTRWVTSKPPMAQPDHVHLTRPGYERLGEVVAKALLPGRAAKGSRKIR